MTAIQRQNVSLSVSILICTVLITIISGFAVESEELEQLKRSFLFLKSPPSDCPSYHTYLPAVLLPSTADPKKTPTTKRPSNLMFILPWWVQPAQSGFHCLALNWNCIHLNHPSHPKQPVETKVALIAQTSPGGAPSPMHLAFLIGKELLCLHWHWLIESDP